MLAKFGTNSGGIWHKMDWFWKRNKLDWCLGSSLPGIGGSFHLNSLNRLKGNPPIPILAGSFMLLSFMLLLKLHKFMYHKLSWWVDSPPVEMGESSGKKHSRDPMKRILQVPDSRSRDAGQNIDTRLENLKNLYEIALFLAALILNRRHDRSVQKSRRI